MPKFDVRLSRYVPITCLRLVLNPPLIVLGNHLVISPNLRSNGMLARNRVGSFWISKEAYEAFGAQSLWRRLFQTVIYRMIKLKVCPSLTETGLFANPPRSSRRGNPNGDGPQQ